MITIIGLLVVIGPVAWLGIGLIEGLIAVVKGHERAVWSAAFSPDGKRVVTASADKTARLWMPRREQRSPPFTDACAIYGDEFASEQIEPARQILEVETIDVVADKGYFKSEDIEACEKAGLTPPVPRPQRGTSVREGFFREDEFRFDAGRDAYICPAGQTLTPIRNGRLRDLKKTDYGNPKACRDCPLRAQCTNDIRSVSRLDKRSIAWPSAWRLDHTFSIAAAKSFRLHQTMDELGRLPHARPRKSPRRVQSDLPNLPRALNILGIEAMMTAVAA